jgi:hypothetical protein
MSEDSNKPPSINLEELERQLREALSRRSASSDPVHQTSGNEDPLSMLARLVEYEGASNQAQLQPVTQAAPSAYAAPEPVQQDSATQQPAHWQPYEEQSQLDSAASYKTTDHLVFDPNHTADLAATRVVVPHPASAYAPYVPQAPVPPSYPNQPAAAYEPATSHSASAGASAYYPGMTQPAETGVEDAQGTFAASASHDYFAPIQPAPAAPAYDAASYQPRRPETNPASPVTHDILALSPSEIRPASDAEALDALYGQIRPSAQPQPEQPSGYSYAPPSADQRSAADRALVYAAAFPDKTSQSSQWTPDTSQGVGISYSEAEANLGAPHRAAEPPPKSQGKGMMILLGLIVVMAGGFGLAAYLRNEGARVPSGAPPVIAADKNPIKVVPANPGGTEVPNQGAAIYQPSKPEDAKDAKVVSTDEKPVDISVAPRPPGSPLIGEPKKIRTVTVRPDGTLVEENTVAAGSPVPNSAAIPRAAPSIVTIQPPTAGQPGAPTPPVAAQPASAPAPQATASANTVRVMPPTRPQTAEPATAQTATPPSARTSSPAPAAAVPLEPAEREPTGDSGVQFSAPASEGEARNAIVALKRSYASILDGRTLATQKAENNGRTIFRVRAVGLSREEAISICEKIKASGGQCFVARN